MTDIVAFIQAACLFIFGLTCVIWHKRLGLYTVNWNEKHFGPSERYGVSREDNIRFNQYAFLIGGMLFMLFAIIDHLP